MSDSPPPLDFTKPLDRGPTWKQKDGTLIPIEEMDDHHLLCSARLIFKRFRHFVVKTNLARSSTPWNEKHMVRFNTGADGVMVKFVDVLKNAQEPDTAHHYLRTLAPTYDSLVHELLARGYSSTQQIDFFLSTNKQEFYDGYPQAAVKATPRDEPPATHSVPPEAVGSGSPQGPVGFQDPQPRSRPIDSLEVSDSLD